MKVCLLIRARQLTSSDSEMEDEGMIESSYLPQPPVPPTPPVRRQSTMSPPNPTNLLPSASPRAVAPSPSQPYDQSAVQSLVSPTTSRIPSQNTAQGKYIH